MDEHVPYYLGIDAGGSLTRAIVVSSLGELVGEGESGGSNPHNSSITTAFTNIQIAVDQALSQASSMSGTILRGCLGLAGFDTAHDKHLLESFLLKQPLYNQTFGAAQLYIVNDALLGLPLVTDQDYGMVVVAGTGSHVLGRNNQDTASSGCWGYVLGDQGSGFAFGQKILQQVMAEYDGRCEPTPLTQAVLQTLQVSNAQDLLPFVYQNTIPVQAIAGLTHLLSDASLFPLLQSQMQELVQALVSACQAVHKRLAFSSESPLPVALVGGVFRQEAVVLEVSRQLTQVFPHAIPQVPQQSSVWGAIKIAQRINHSSQLPTQAIVIERSHY